MHEVLFQNFLRQKLHSTILFVGKKGIGKYNIALALATKILNYETGHGNEKSTAFFDDDVETVDETTSNLINEKRHPDLLIIEKTEKEIKVDAVEKILDFALLSPFVSKNKILIINAIDDMNKNAQNGILKIIEEPPKNTYIFLICNNINNILLTIKSRCFIVDVPTPSFDVWQREVGENATTDLYNITGGSITFAKSIIKNEFANIYNEIKFLLAQNSLAIEKLHEFANMLEDDSSGEDRWNIFAYFLMLYLYDALKTLIVNKNKDSFGNFVVLNNEEKILIKIEKIREILKDTEILNLNKKHAVVVCFLILSV